MGGAEDRCREVEGFAMLRERANREERKVDEGCAIFVGGLQRVGESHRAAESSPVWSRMRREVEVATAPIAEQRAGVRDRIEREGLPLAIVSPRHSRQR